VVDAIARAFYSLVRLAHLLRIVWFDLVYAVVTASLTPVLITHAATG